MEQNLGQNSLVILLLLGSTSTFLFPLLL